MERVLHFVGWVGIALVQSTLCIPLEVVHLESGVLRRGEEGGGEERRRGGGEEGRRGGVEEGQRKRLICNGYSITLQYALAQAAFGLFILPHANSAYSGTKSATERSL